MARIVKLADGRTVRVDRKGNILGDAIEVDKNLNLQAPENITDNQAQQESRLIDAYQVKPNETLNNVLLGDEVNKSIIPSQTTQSNTQTTAQTRNVASARRRTVNKSNTSTKVNTQQKNDNNSSSKVVSTKQTAANKTRNDILKQDSTNTTKQDSTTVTKPNPNVKSDSSKRYAITDRRTGKVIGYSSKPGSNKQNTVQQKVNNDNNSKSEFVKGLSNIPKFIPDNNVNINYTKYPKHSRTSILDMINNISKPFRNKH